MKSAEDKAMKHRECSRGGGGMCKDPGAGEKLERRRFLPHQVHRDPHCTEFKKEESKTVRFNSEV